jgi:hypothetical protein
LSIDPTWDSADLDKPQSWNRYAYVRNNPVGSTDPDGKIVDTLIDVAFVGYDLYDIGKSVYQGKPLTATQGIALAADVGAAFVPFVTGAGPAVRAAAHADGALHAAEGVEHSVEAALHGSDAASHGAQEAKQMTQYKRPSGATTAEQRASVQGKPCATCGAADGGKRVADHKEPLVVEHYRTGGVDKTKMRDVGSVQPQCTTCSARQGGYMSQFSKAMKKFFGF